MYCLSKLDMLCVCVYCSIMNMEEDDKILKIYLYYKACGSKESFKGNLEITLSNSSR